MRSNLFCNFVLQKFKTKLLLEKGLFYRSQTMYNKSGPHTKALKGLLIEHKSLFEFQIAFDDQFSLPPAKSDLNAFNTFP